MMQCISFRDIIDCNAVLEDKKLRFKIHLRDACGKQSCWIEPLGNCACEGRFEDMYQVIEEFFKTRGLDLEYGDDKLTFWVKN